MKIRIELYCPNCQSAKVVKNGKKLKTCCFSKKKNEITPYNQWLNNNSEYVKRNPNDEDVSNVRRYINYIKKIIQAYEKIKLYDIYKFNKKTTENIMDYDLSNQKSFTIWQVRIMQEEVLNYYH